MDRKPDAVGNPSYSLWACSRLCCCNPGTAFSGRELSENLEDRISFSHFCGFSLDYEVPDNSTICRFRNQLHEKGLAKPLPDLINRQIAAGGLEIKADIIVDASIVESSRRPRKQQEVVPVDREEDDDEPEACGHEVKTGYSGDEQAAWNKKGNRVWYGYKVQAAVDAEPGVILAGHVTPANGSGCQEMMEVVSQCGLAEGAPVFADKGYTSQASRCELE